MEVYLDKGNNTKLKFLSEKEKKLLEFCKKNCIPYEIEHIDSLRGKHVIHLSFEPRYLDELESKIVEYCNKHNIQFEFKLEEGTDGFGIHHYVFKEFIDFSKDVADSATDAVRKLCPEEFEPIELRKESSTHKKEKKQSVFQKVCSFFKKKPKEEALYDEEQLAFGLHDSEIVKKCKRPRRMK